MKTCVSVGEESLAETLAACEKAVELGADMLEVRFDLMTELPSSIEEFRKISLPKIATLRTQNQGGGYKGTDGERLKFFKKAIASEFEFIDLEYTSKLFSEKELSHARMICSYHDFQGTPSTAQIIDILVGCMAKGEIAKAAFQVNRIKDIASIVDASRFVSSTEKKFIVIGMGELGEVTRIRSDRLNSAWTYLSVGKRTAPGQIDLQTAKWLGSCPLVVGVTGYPLGHTASPPMHNAVFRALDLPGKYLAFPTAKEELDDLIYILMELDLNGMNVTIPHKETIIEWMDELSAEAKAIGAVNVIKNKKGRLVGLNTDFYGIKRTFEEKRISVKGKRSLVIGAGGAARACCAFLKEAGAAIFVTNRNQSHAQALARDFGATLLTQSQAEKMEFEVMVNCTPLGMEGYPSISPLAESMFRPGQVVMDVIYNPPMTPFLKLAAAKGATILRGMDMLIYQAMNSFEAWTGRSPPYEIMEKAAREAIE